MLVPPGQLADPRVEVGGAQQAYWLLVEFRALGRDAGLSPRSVLGGPVLELARV